MQISLKILRNKCFDMEPTVMLKPSVMKVDRLADKDPFDKQQQMDYNVQRKAFSGEA